MLAAAALRWSESHPGTPPVPAIIISLPLIADMLRRCLRSDSLPLSRLEASLSLLLH